MGAGQLGEEGGEKPHTDGRRRCGPRGEVRQHDEVGLCAATVCLLLAKYEVIGSASSRARKMFPREDMRG